MKKHSFDINLISPLNELNHSQKITQFLERPRSNYMFFGKYPDGIEFDLDAHISKTNIEQKIISKYCASGGYGLRSYMLMCPDNLLEKIKDNQTQMKIKFDLDNIKMCNVQVVSTFTDASLNNIQNRYICLEKTIGIFKSNIYLNENNYLNDEHTFKTTQGFVCDSGFPVSVFHKKSNFITTDGFMNLNEFLYESIRGHLGGRALMDWSYTVENSQKSHHINALMIDIFL